MANLQFKNVTTQPVPVWKRNLLTENSNIPIWDAFDISVGGVKVEYIGIMVKRPPPTTAEYRTLAPGETLDVRVDLTSC